jgi:hypothetical protein
VPVWQTVKGQGLEVACLSFETGGWLSLATSRRILNSEPLELTSNGPSPKTLTPFIIFLFEKSNQIKIIFILYQ